MRPYVEELAPKSGTFVHAYPNAGLPNEVGEYDETPDQMGAVLKDFISSDFVNIVGGCCGTTPELIRELASLVETTHPRKKTKITHNLRPSVPEPRTLTPQT